MYTCCIVYADEDEMTSQMITEVFTKVYGKSKFFLPQFDMRIGCYIYDTTARVIMERCNGRVILLLSKYFLASDVCKFAARFVASRTSDSLIPVFLCDNAIPITIEGLAGIRWYRKNGSVRTRHWDVLTTAVFQNIVCEKDLRLIREKVNELVTTETSNYLQDVKYDENIPSAGPPVDISPYDQRVAPEQEEDVASSPEQETRTGGFLKFLRRWLPFTNSGEIPLTDISSPAGVSNDDDIDDCEEMTEEHSF